MTIGFYLHHQGRGHINRGKAIIAELASPCTVLTSAPVAPDFFATGTELIALPPDWDNQAEWQDPAPGGLLHWAPLSGGLAKDRSAAIAEFLQRRETELLVCDVSVEVALLARLFGVRTITIRSHGDRSDPAHVLGFAISKILLAPYPEILEHSSTPLEVMRRTSHAGFVHDRRDDRESHDLRQQLAIADRQKLLVIAVGAGGTQLDLRELEAAAELLPTWTFVVLGTDLPSNHARVLSLGWVHNVREWMAAADVVAGHGGHNLVTDALVSRRPFLCVPEHRAYREQVRRAERLEELGLAIVIHEWPDAKKWPELVHSLTGNAPPRLFSELDFQGARNCARLIEECA